eukprot:GSChrysophyteH1.ASY1.ANO1.1626.1 assembled CDS
MASHFVASTCKLEGDAFVSQLKWSKIDLIAAMAVSTVDDNDQETHQILFVNNEGELISNSSITHDYEANTFEWQPNGRILAIGWADGMVSCWNVDGRARPSSSFSNSSQHIKDVLTVVWAPGGKRIISGDKGGAVCVWTVDARGTLSPLRQYKKKGEICCALTVGDARRAEAKAACPPFFFGTDRGSVTYADDQGFCSDVQQLNSSIDTMLYYEERARLVIVTRSLLLTQYQVSEDGKVSRVMQVKLSVAGDVEDKGLKSVVWASPGLLCMATQEKMVRLLDLAADESYNLSLSALGGIVERSDKVISVAFGPLNRYLAVGTQGGVIGIWRFTGPSRDVSGSRSATIATSAEDWELHYKTSLPSPVHELSWHAGQGCAGAVTDDGAVVLSETVMQSGMSGDLYVVQKSSHEVSIHVGGGQESNVWVEHTGMIVRGLAVGASCFVVWNGKSIFVAEGGVVKIANFRGTQKGTITFSEGEGQPEVLDLNGQYLGVLTSKGVVKFFDVHTPTKPKALGSAGNFEANKANEDTDMMHVRRPHSSLHVFDRNRGAVSTFDFNPFKRCPSNIFWDVTDDRMLAVEATKNRSHAAVEGEGDVADVEVFLFFATTENGLLMQDSFQRKSPYGNMLGINVPRLYFRDVGDSGGADGDSDDRRYEGKEGDSVQTKVYSKVMRDFVGLDQVTEDMRSALLNFSYNLTLGKLDEAYRAVKAIDSPAIWENMAQMCVKTKRLDVAEVCLGNMGHARGAAAVRLSKQEGDSVEASVGVLAIQLGLLDDAARLFRESERWDKLNKLYQSAGIWDKAVKVATTHDRIHLKNTYHFYAKHLESIGEVEDAIYNYEQAGTSMTEVPRMLFNLNKLDDLEDYVHQSSDATLMKWWGKYLESQERYDKAKKYYSRAGDYLSLVRIACFKGDLDRAAEIVHESDDSAAAYHLARQLENRGEHQEAINYYAKSKCFNHSIRLARAYGLDGELMRFALKSTKSLMLDCGDYFENKGEPDKAIQLYHKGGDLGRALDLCFRAVNANAAVFDMMNAIVNDLGADSSPETLQKCAEFLVMHKQYERAVELFVMAKKYVEAIEMCLANRVNITEEMVQIMSPPEKPASNAKEEVYMDANARKEILKDIAKALKIQGSFILASKKYTQAGDRVRAIKCLVRGGDTKAVIQFASISRNAEIYKLAANYLQQMNWRESVDIMKAIIQFYTKAKSFEQLAGFYDSCAQVEIDDYRDYEKAIGALREALKHLGKANTRSAADMASRFEQRISLIERFVQVRRMAQKDPDTMVTVCEGLLQEPLLDEAIRTGDCLAMLVEHYHSRGKMREASACLRDFENRRINPGPYVDAGILDAIYKATGEGPGNRNSDEDEDEIGEEIAEELDEEIESSPHQRHNRQTRGGYSHK